MPENIIPTIINMSSSAFIEEKYKKNLAVNAVTQLSSLSTDYIRGRPVVHPPIPIGKSSLPKLSPTPAIFGQYQAKGTF